MGNVYILLILGVGLGVFSFVVVVLVETSVMKRFFRFPLLQRLKYSMITNLVTVAAGYFFLDYVIFRFEGFFETWIVTIILTILFEYICLLLLIREKNLFKSLLGYSIVANILSYGFLFFMLIVAGGLLLIGSPM